MTDLSRDHYVADAAIVWCFDNRFWQAFQDLVKERKFRYFDPVVVAGGAKSLSGSAITSDKDFLLRQIETSIKLHHTKKVVLTTHEDCGAFGGSKSFDSDRVAEIKNHNEILLEAKKATLQKFPKLLVELCFVHFNGYMNI